MRIQHNIMAMNAYRNLGMNNSKLSKNLEKLSSGYRINRAGDDAAGLAISEKMRAQIAGLDQAQKNAQSGINLVQTAEGALTEVHDMLNRMVTLSTQAANGTYTETDRDKIQAEINALTEEIDRIADNSNFNGQKLLDGSIGGGAVSANGATFQGAEVAKYQEASQTVTLGDWSSTNITAAKDTFVIDGQSLVIDWANDADAKKVFASLNAKHDALTADSCKDLAQKVEDLFNQKMQEQGLSGSVKVTGNGATGFKIESTDKTYASEISFAGSDAADPAKALGAKMFGSTKGESKVNEATKNYNGDTIATGSQFIMEINGVKVNVSTTADITKDTTDMDTAATTLQTNIQTAVTAYNTAMGLTAGTKDAKSGLTGLTTTDFTVKEENGAFKVEYTGDEDVTFSFEDVGEKTIASALGLASGSSKSGGATGLTLQIGSEAVETINVSIDSMKANDLGIKGLKIGTEAQANDAIDKVKKAIEQVSVTRGNLGAIQNRLEHTINNLGVMEENIQDAESNIRDTDIADEMMAYTKNNILIQSAQAMLAQANQAPQGVLQLMQ